MSSKQSFWYSLGYAFERARTAPADGRRALATFAERAPTPSPEGRAPRASRTEDERPARAPTDDLLATGAVLALTRVLNVWRPRERTGIGGLIKAGAAGAAAALLVELVRPLLRGEPGLPALDRGTGERMLAGAGQGVLYGAVVEPRLLGPALLKGTLYGSAEYAVDEMGGLSKLLGSHVPLRRVPGLGALLDDLDPHDRAYLEHVTFGIALGLLYGVGSSPSSNGIVIDDDE